MFNIKEFNGYSYRCDQVLFRFFCSSWNFTSAIKYGHFTLQTLWTVKLLLLEELDVHLTLPVRVPKMLELRIAKANQRLMNSFSNPLLQLKPFTRAFRSSKTCIHVIYIYSIQIILLVLHIVHISSHLIACPSFQVHCLLYVVIWCFGGIAGHCWVLLGVAGQWEDRRSHTSHDLPTSLSLPNHERLMKTGQETLALGVWYSSCNLHAYYAPAPFNGPASNCLCWYVLMLNSQKFLVQSSIPIAAHTSLLYKTSARPMLSALTSYFLPVSSLACVRDCERKRFQMIQTQGVSVNCTTN